MFRPFATILLAAGLTASLATAAHAEPQCKVATTRSVNVATHVITTTDSYVACSQLPYYAAHPETIR